MNPKVKCDKNHYLFVKALLARVLVKKQAKNETKGIYVGKIKIQKLSLTGNNLTWTLNFIY